MHFLTTAILSGESSPPGHSNHADSLETGLAVVGATFHNHTDTTDECECLTEAIYPTSTPTSPKYYTSQATSNTTAPSYAYPTPSETIVPYLGSAAGNSIGSGAVLLAIAALV